jgi:hypothetical protein
MALGLQKKLIFFKLIQIISAGGYKGYLPVETLMVRDISYDPFALVLEILRELEDAMKH